MTGLLALEEVSRRFGSVKATDRFSMTLAEGEALGVIGPNGAGKSTMFNIVTGGVRPSAGRVFFAGADITRAPAHERCRMGIGRSYQIPHPFANMTVFENLLVGAAFGGARSEAACYEDCHGILARTGLLEKANRPAGSLTLLERKRLEMARALATRPRVLLLDEIAGGLTEHEIHALVETIEAVRGQGVSIVWVEHIVHALLSVVDRLAVLNFGRKIDDGDPRAVIDSPAVREVYMGIAVE